MKTVKRAKFPISWMTFQAVMADYGYEMISHEPDGSGVIFRLRSDATTEGYKNPLTVVIPDTVGSDGQTLCFERDYVIDLIQLAMKNGTPHRPVATILAKRHMDS